MGALLLSLGPIDDPEVANRFHRMAARSPNRGDVSVYEAEGLAMGVQSLGWDASLARRKHAVVAFHGYVGNWEELKVSLGLSFDEEESHAEIIAGLFEQYEGKVVSLLRGEFAVLIYDVRRQRILAARDVVGCRPLNMQLLGEACLVSSEIRQLIAGSGIAAEPNPGAFANHLVFEPAVDTETLVTGIECVMPGEIYSFPLHRDGFTPHRRSYWCIEDVQTGPVADIDEWLEELERRIKRAVKRSIPGHPSALTLSGGLDSSALWAEVVALRKGGFAGAMSVRPLSLYFPGYPCDEQTFVERTLRDTGGRVLAVDGTQETSLSLRPTLLEHVDTVPFATSYFVWLMAKAAAADGRKTLITGHLGDHLFDIRLPKALGRAARVLRVILNGMFGWSRAHNVLLGLRRLIRRNRHESELDLLQGEWKAGVIERRWIRGLRRVSPFEVIRDRLACERTAWSLRSWEQICAGFGIEVRHPFADPDLISFAATVPRSLLSSGLTKPGLRAVYRQRLPEIVINRPHKVAFDCLLENDEPSLAGILPTSEWYLVMRGIIDPEVLDSLLHTANNQLRARNRVLSIEAAELVARGLVGKAAMSG